MHIIVFAHRLATPRSMTLTMRHVALAAALATVTMLAGASLLYYVSIKYAASIKLPVLESLLKSVQADDKRKNEEYLRQNLNAMAVKLGEMQAQLMRLDALGERVSGLAGVKPQEFRSSEPPGRGGAITSQMRDLSLTDFARELDKLARGLENRSDYLNVAESELFNAKLKSKRLPTALPVNADYNASGFGIRIDLGELIWVNDLRLVINTEIIKLLFDHAPASDQNRSCNAFFLNLIRGANDLLLFTLRKCHAFCPA